MTALLTPAPLPISQNLLLEPQVTAENTAQVSSSQPLSYLGTSEGTAVNPEAPKKRAQPEHLLKFRNRPYGFDTPGPGKKAQLANGGDVEMKEAASQKSSKEEKKKRKSEGKHSSSPKKKKVKA